MYIIFFNVSIVKIFSMSIIANFIECINANTDIIITITYANVETSFVPQNFSANSPTKENNITIGIIISSIHILNG